MTCDGSWNVTNVIVSYLRKDVDPANNAQFLSGTTLFPLPAGSILMMRRQGDEYVLIAVTDGRPQGSKDPQSLLSFVEEAAIKRPTPEDLRRPKSKGKQT